MKEAHTVSNKSQVGAAESATHDTSWAKNYKITHRPDRLLASAGDGPKRRPQQSEEKILRYLEEMWKYNRIAASEAGDGQRRSRSRSHNRRRHRHHDAIPRSKFSSETPPRMNARDDSSRTLSSPGSSISDRWNIEVGLGHQDRSDRESASSSLYINTGTGLSAVPDLTFHNNNPSSPSTAEQASPVTPPDQDFLIARTDDGRQNRENTCPMPSCGQTLLSSADRERNLCSKCRRDFSSPYSSPPNTHLVEDGHEVNANRITSMSGDKTCRPRRPRSPLRRPDNLRNITTGTQPTKEQTNEHWLSGPLLEPKTFCPSPLNRKFPSLIKNSKEGSISRRRQQLNDGSSSGGSKSGSMSRGHTRARPQHDVLTLRGRSWRSTEAGTTPLAVGGQHRKTMGRESNPELKVGPRPAAVGGSAAEGEHEKEKENMDLLIDEIIDFYLHRPDSSDLELESRRIEALASYHSKTPEPEKMSIDNWI